MNGLSIIMVMVFATLLGFWLGTLHVELKDEE
jgi:hypothetical protein